MLPTRHLSYLWPKVGYTTAIESLYTFLPRSIRQDMRDQSRSQLIAFSPPEIS